jgi:hypothetical protein
VAVSAAVFPETNVTTAKPDQGVVLCAKAASRFPEQTIRTEMNTRTLFPPDENACPKIGAICCPADRGGFGKKYWCSGLLRILKKN